MGYPLEALKAEAMSYKLAMTQADYWRLYFIHEFIEGGEYADAEEYIEKKIYQLNDMRFLIKKTDTGQTKFLKEINFRSLLSKAINGSIGDLEKEALLSASNPETSEFIHYINQTLDEKSPTHNHYTMQQVHLGQGFNRPIIMALNKLAKVKKLDV